jgi:hypothetical protein
VAALCVQLNRLVHRSRCVARQSPHLFVGLDADGNQSLAFDEMCVLLVENIPGASPANRDNNPVVIEVPRGGGVATVSVIVHFAGAGPLTPFFQIAHDVALSRHGRSLQGTMGSR